MRLFLYIVMFVSFLNAVQVESLNSKMEIIKVEIPDNPKRVAVADLASLDTIDALGYGDRVVATTKAQSVYYLDKYKKDKNVINIGSVKEVDLEALMMSEPDVIFIGIRLASEYDKLSNIAPVVMLAIDYKSGTFDSVKKNVDIIAKIFGAKVGDKFSEFRARLDKLKELGSGKTAIIAMVSNSNINTLGNQKRCSMIPNDVGFINLAANAKTTHGNDANFEFIAKLDPEYLFVLDRDSAIGTSGTNKAKQVLDNDIIAKTKAHKEGKIYYLNPAVWYLSEGGLRAMDEMIKDLEIALNLR